MKIQIKFQKILFIVSLVIAAIALVYGFAFCTGALSYAFYARSGMFSAPYKDNPINVDELYTFVMGEEYDSGLWSNSGMGFNSLIVILCIVLVVIAALQFLFSSNKRRNYYITNYISVGILVVFAIVVAAIGFWGVARSEALFNQIDFEWYKDVYDRVIAGTGMGWQYYSDSHVMFALGYVVFAIVLADAVLLVLNTVWKVLLMKGEKALLSNNLKSETTEEVAQ